MKQVTYYKVIHYFFTKQPGFLHYFNIGIYDSEKLAKAAVAELRMQEGFCVRSDNFYIFRVVRLSRPKFLNRTHWESGFFSYTYSKK